MNRSNPGISERDAGPPPGPRGRPGPGGRALRRVIGPVALGLAGGAGLWSATRDIEQLARQVTTDSLVRAAEALAAAAPPGAEPLTHVRRHLVLPPSQGSHAVIADAAPADSRQSRVRLCPEAGACGTASLTIRWSHPWAATGTARMLAMTLAPCAAVIAGLLLAHWHWRRATLTPLRERCVRLEDAARLGRCAQIIAHDIRRPLGQARLVARALAEAADPERLRQIAGSALPRLEQAIAAADALIDHVLAAGDPARALPVKPADPDRLLARALADTARSRPSAATRFSWRWGHGHKVMAEPDMLIRAVSNLLVNAVDALAGDGLITVTTRDRFESGRPFVELAVHNAGDPIPTAVQLRLFEPYFSANRQGGTGLGLPITRQIALAHGGRVEFDSDRRRGTEFRLIIPAAPGQPAAHGPALADSLPAALAAESPLTCAQTARRLAGELEARLAGAGRPLGILHVPGESMVPDDRTALGELLPVAVRGRVQTTCCGDPGAALATALSRPYDMVIAGAGTDAELAAAVALLVALRESGWAGAFILQSEMTLPPESGRLLAVLAQGRLPATPPQEDLLAVLLLGMPPPAPTTAPPLENGVIAVVDDDPFILDLWQRADGLPAAVRIFPSPEALLARLEREPDFGRRLVAVVTDFCFAGTGGMSGADLAATLRHRSAAPIMLASDMPRAAIAQPELFDWVTGKDTDGPATLAALLGQRRTARPA